MAINKCTFSLLRRSCSVLCDPPSAIIPDINEASRTSSSKLRGGWSVLVALASCSTADNHGNIASADLCSDVPSKVAGMTESFSVARMLMVDGHSRREVGWQREGGCI